jgi:hypothetical protein
MLPAKFIRQHVRNAIDYRILSTAPNTNQLFVFKLDSLLTYWTDQDLKQFGIYDVF